MTHHSTTAKSLETMAECEEGVPCYSLPGERCTAWLALYHYSSGGWLMMITGRPRPGTGVVTPTTTACHPDYPDQGPALALGSSPTALKLSARVANKVQR